MIIVLHPAHGLITTLQSSQGEVTGSCDHARSVMVAGGKMVSLTLMEIELPVSGVAVVFKWSGRGKRLLPCMPPWWAGGRLARLARQERTSRLPCLFVHAFKRKSNRGLDGATRDRGVPESNPWTLGQLATGRSTTTSGAWQHSRAPCSHPERNKFCTRRWSTGTSYFFRKNASVTKHLGPNARLIIMPLVFSVLAMSTAAPE